MIRLRVVGVFYDNEFSIDQVQPNTGGKKTIKELLDLATATNESFGYALLNAAGNVVSGGPGVSGGLVGFHNKLIAPLAAALSLRPRDAGTYEIYESNTSFPNGTVLVNAWQYYVVRGGKVVSNASRGMGSRDVSPVAPVAGSGFTPFSKEPIEKDDEIIWRNVVIATKPRP